MSMIEFNSKEFVDFLSDIFGGMSSNESNDTPTEPIINPVTEDAEEDCCGCCECGDCECYCDLFDEDDYYSKISDMIATNSEGKYRVKFKNPYVIVFWKDNTITKVKCSSGDTYDVEKGLAMAIIKKLFDNSYFRDMTKVITNAEEMDVIPFDRKSKKTGTTSTKKTSTTTKKSTTTKTSNTKKSNSNTNTIENKNVNKK